MLVAVIPKFNTINEKLVLRNFRDCANNIPSDRISLLSSIQRDSLVQTRKHILDQIYIISFNRDCNDWQYEGVKFHANFWMPLSYVLIAKPAEIKLLVALIFKIGRKSKLPIHKPPYRFEALASVYDGKAKPSF